MLKLEIVADSHQELIAELSGLAQSLRSSSALNPVLVETRPAAEPAPAARQEHVASASVAPAETAQAAQPRRPGRPRKDTDAPSPQGDAPPAPEAVSVSAAQPAVANTGSADAGAPPAVVAASSSVAAETAAGPTFDQLKETMQKAAAVQDGLRHVTAILHEFGYQKVKEIKPEHYGAMHAKALALLPGDAA